MLFFLCSIFLFYTKRENDNEEKPGIHMLIFTHVNTHNQVVVFISIKMRIVRHNIWIVKKLLVEAMKFRWKSNYLWNVDQLKPN